MPRVRLKAAAKGISAVLIYQPLNAAEVLEIETNETLKWMPPVCTYALATPYICMTSEIEGECRGRLRSSASLSRFRLFELLIGEL